MIRLPSRNCCLVLVAGLLSGLAGGCGPSVIHPDSAQETSMNMPAPQTWHTTEMRQPPVPRGVVTDQRDGLGQPVTLQCQACHQVRPANGAVSKSTDMDEFHQGLRMAHGRLKCVSCHNPADGYASLRLADGSTVSFAESLTLCAQCHSSQFRDYQHGAHGGMTGYWDLSRGPRQKNHCLHCHDAHAPKYPTFQPVAPPRDRFAPAVTGEHHE